MTWLGLTLRSMNVLGWPRGAAEDAAHVAVEVAGSNAPIFSSTSLGQVVSEACLVDGEGWNSPCASA